MVYIQYNRAGYIIGNTVVLFALASLFLISIIADAKSLQHKEKDKLDTNNVRIYVYKEKLRKVIDVIASRNNMSVKMHGRFKNVISRQRFDGTMESVLDNLSNTNDLDWFSYNKTLYVSKRSSRSTKFFNLRLSVFNKLLKRLSKTGRNISKVSFQKIKGTTISVTAPPAFLAIVETIISTQTKEKYIANAKKIELYRGIKLHQIEVDETLEK